MWAELKESIDRVWKRSVLQSLTAAQVQLWPLFLPSMFPNQRFVDRNLLERRKKYYSDRIKYRITVFFGNQTDF